MQLKNPKQLATCIILLTALGCKQRQTGASLQPERLDFKISETSGNFARWSGKITLPLVPGAASHLPDGRILFWSAADRFNFTLGTGKTQAVFFDPKTGASTTKEIAETGHDMFCPGTTNLADGLILINGGKNSEKTTIFNPFSNQWLASDAMRIPRGYQANTILPDGKVFTFGGSWSGNNAKSKDAEVWASGKWRTLPNIRMDPNFYADYAAIRDSDNHFWLQPMSNGRVLHFGPGVRMHWIDTGGDGDVEPVGRRGADESALNGSAVMYDIDRILKVGGARNYGTLATTTLDASNSAYTIGLGNDGKITTQKLSPMKYRRVFSNAVVLPGGQVLVTGGATRPKLFSDDNGVLIPEIWNPNSQTFSVLPAPPETIARNYHSIGLLLPDARVIIGGGGMIGNPAVDHPDIQILSPPYLFTANGQPATRPEILSAPKETSNGQMIQVTARQNIAAFDLIRMSSVTHSINNDQRRIPIPFSITAPNQYRLTIPNNPSTALPGYYMLFAISETGVPSIAHLIRLGAPQPSTSVNEAPNLYVWRFIASVATPPSGSKVMNYMYAVSGTPSMPEVPAGFSVDPDAPGFIFQAWEQQGTERVPVYLCTGVNGRHSLQAGRCEDGKIGPLLFHAYSNPRPGTSKVLRYVHSESSANLLLPSTVRNRDQIDAMDGLKGFTKWNPVVKRGPNLEKGSFYAAIIEPDSNPDVFVWRFFAAPTPAAPNSRSNYMYVTTNNPIRPANPPGFIGDPTAPNFSFKAWSTGADGRIPVYLCQQPGSNRFWLGAKCEGDRITKQLFFAYKQPLTDTAKVLHYANNRWGGKLLIPDSPENKGQIISLNDTGSPETWAGWITQSESRLDPFFVSINNCQGSGACNGDKPDVAVWRFYSKVLPGRPDPRSDFYYMVTQDASPPVPPQNFQTDPTALGPSFLAWSSPGKGRIPVFLCQNPVGKQFWIGNGCAGDTQQAVLFYAYNEEIPGTVRSLHYLSTRWNGKLILPNTTQLQGQINGLDKSTPADPWVSFINRTTLMALSPFWVMPPAL